MTMMLIAQGGAKMAQSGSRLLQPKFANTKYGKAMKTRTTQGNLSPGQEQNIINRVSDTATRQGNVATNRYVGQMYNQGMGNSVALNRGLREAQNDVRRTVTDTSKGIYRDEELAKSKAKMDYAQAMDQDKAGRRQAIAGMVGAGLETAGQYFGNKATQSKAQDQSYIDAMNKFGNTKAYQTPSGKTRFTGSELPKGVDKFISDYNTDNDPAKLFGRLLESGMNREDAKDLMKFIDSQTKNKPSKKVDYSGFYGGESAFDNFPQLKEQYLKSLNQ